MPDQVRHDGVRLSNCQVNNHLATPELNHSRPSLFRLSLVQSEMNPRCARTQNASPNLADNGVPSMTRKLCRENEDNLPDCHARNLQRCWKEPKPPPVAFEKSGHTALLSETLRSPDKPILLPRQPAQMP